MNYLFFRFTVHGAFLIQTESTHIEHTNTNSTPLYINLLSNSGFIYSEAYPIKHICKQSIVIVFLPM
jgi:hypothetical protein